MLKDQNTFKEYEINKKKTLWKDEDICGSMT